MFKLRLTISPDDRVRAVVYPDRGLISQGEVGTRPLVNKTKLENPGSNADSLRVGWGRSPDTPSRFSAYGRRRLQCALGWLDKAVSRHELLFITLTLPSSTLAAWRQVAANSSRLVHNFKAWVNNRIRSKFDAYVWEYQRRGALHLHYVVHCPDRAAGEYIKLHCKDQWIRQLDRLSETSGVDMYERGDGTTWASRKSVTRVEVATVKKSVSRYMSKYLSKSLKGGVASSDHPAPARWWGISRPLSAAVESSTRSISVYCAANLSACGSVFERLRHWAAASSLNGFIESSPFPRVRQFCFSIEAENYESVASDISSIFSYRDAKMIFDGLFNQVTKESKMTSEPNNDYMPMIFSAVSIMERNSWVLSRFVAGAASPSVASYAAVRSGRRVELVEAASLANDIRFAITGLEPNYDGPNQSLHTAIALCNDVMRIFTSSVPLF